MADITTLPATPNANATTVPPKLIPNINKLATALRIAKGHRITYWRKSQDKQMTILVYLYNHEKLSMPALRNMMHFNKITSYRHTAVLKKLGLIKWKGSHKNGAYYITEKGKEFVEKNG
jgi:DNA-binding MarR family transcriptional regulator